MFLRSSSAASNAAGPRVAQETDERVVIALSRLEPVGLKTLIAGYQRHQADLELRAPVGDRAVIDASAGVVRPALAQPRSRPGRRWPPPAGGLAVETDIWIEELPISFRAYNALKRSGVHTVEDLARLSAEEVASTPGVGRKAFDEIVGALAACGLTLTRVGKG